MKINQIVNFLKDKNINKNKILLISGIVGMLLILLSAIIPANNNKHQETIATNTLEQYSNKLKKQLEDTVSSISEAGEASVFITFERGYEYVYATTDKISNDKSENSKTDGYSADIKSTDEENVVIIKTDEGEKPLVITEIEPKVKGIVIVCEGGGNKNVVNRVKSAISVSMGIDQDKICVVPKTK